MQLLYRNTIRGTHPSLRSLTLLLVIAWLPVGLMAGAEPPKAAPSSPHAHASRRAQLVEANIIAVEAYQTILARQKSGSSPACYPLTKPDTATLKNLVKHQQSLLAEPAVEVVRWADSQPSSFDPAKDLEPLLHADLLLSPDLPVNVFTRYLRKQVPKQPDMNLRSVANLYQTTLELERDGDLLQDLYHFYIALKLPVYVGQLGLPGTDADFLVAARKLAGKSCASPVDLSVSAWQIAGRKIWDWGIKNLHIRDKYAIAQELLKEPKFVKLIPQIKTMPPVRIAVIGHSFTMDAHWSSPSSFAPIVATMFGLEYSRAQFSQWSAGGLKYGRAYREFYPAALAWKPNIVLLVLENKRPEDAGALKKMAAGFRAAGARVLMFDDVEDHLGPGEPTAAQTDAIARRAGVEIIPARAILDAAQKKEGSFTCMDGIHKIEPYHRLMAYLWLQAILANK